MPHDQDEVEGIALQLIVGAKCDPRAPVLAVDVAQHTPGLDIAFRGGISRSRLVAANTDGGACIEVPHGLSMEIVHAEVSHELAEWRFGMDRYSEPDIEAESGRLARAIGAPLPAFSAAFASAGLDLEYLSALFMLPQSEIARRIGELTGWPCALVAPSYVERGGADVLPDDQALRLVAASGGFGAVKVLQLTDVARRWLVIATR